MTLEPSVSDPYAAFARQQLIDWWDQPQLATSHVFVVGAGALGNEVLKNLALLGVGQIYVVDFDQVEPSNLSRGVLFRSQDCGARQKAEVAAERIAQINPLATARVAYLNGDVAWDIGSGVYRAMTVVIGCVDNVEARRCINLQSWRAGVAWIDGGIWQLTGSVGIYTATPETACYECGMTDALRKLANQRYSCMSGVVRSKILQGHEATTQTTSAIIAAIQTQEAIKLCHGREVAGGSKLFYHGLLHNFDHEDPSIMTITALARDAACVCHQESTYGEIIVAPLTNQDRMQAVFDFAQTQLDMRDPVVDFGALHPSALGRRFITSASCSQCSYQRLIERPAHQVMDQDVICPNCPFECPCCQQISSNHASCPTCEQADPPIQIDRPTLRLEAFSAIDASSPYAQWTLAALGIPNLEIIKLSDATGEALVQIGDDLNLVFTTL